MKQIAIQGIQGAFHHIAAQQLFADEDISLICCETFGEVFATVAHDSHVLGLVAIENTIAGSLLPNYELLRKSGLTIAAEHKLHIEHSIMCLPEDDYDTLTEVNSHPVALAQCQEYLDKHPQLKKVEKYDTAGSAKLIAEGQWRGHAAICHADAANIYGLKVLERGIEDNKHNFTRFLLVADQWSADALRDVRRSDKASLVFSLSHDAGCLSQVLSVFSFYQINLTKIQSLPIVGREWEYLFYVDVQYDDYLRFSQSLDAVTPLTREIRVLGHYMSKASPTI